MSIVACASSGARSADGETERIPKAMERLPNRNRNARAAETRAGDVSRSGACWEPVSGPRTFPAR